MLIISNEIIQRFILVKKAKPYGAATESYSHFNHSLTLSAYTAALHCDRIKEDLSGKSTSSWITESAVTSLCDCRPVLSAERVHSPPFLRLCFSLVSTHRRSWSCVTSSVRHLLNPFKSRRHGCVLERAEAQTPACGWPVAWPVAVRSQVISVVLQCVHQLCFHIMERYGQVRAALRTLRNNNTQISKHIGKRY